MVYEFRILGYLWKGDGGGVVAVYRRGVVDGWRRVVVVNRWRN